MRITLRLSGQEFWPECIVGVFALKLVHSIYSGPWYKRKILYKDKKSSGKFRTRMPIGPSRPIGQEFRPKRNIVIFAWKRVYGIYRGPGNEWKILNIKNKK